MIYRLWIIPQSWFIADDIAMFIAKLMPAVAFVPEPVDSPTAFKVFVLAPSSICLGSSTLTIRLLPSELPSSSLNYSRLSSTKT